MKKKSEGSASVPGDGKVDKGVIVESCPNCGYCPHCGQSRQAAPWYPYVPYNPPWYVFRAPHVWLGGSLGQSVTLTTTDNPTGITYTI